MQSDTIVPQPGSIQSYDRYAYVNNNPLRYTDPSGHRVNPCDDFDPYCGVDGGARANAYASNKTKNAKPALPSTMNNYKQPSPYRHYNYGQPNQSSSSPSIMLNSGSDSTSYTVPLIPPSYPSAELWYSPRFGSQQYYFAGYEEIINPNKIDKFDMAVDKAGLVADGSYFISYFIPEIAPVTLTIAGISQGLEWLGVGKAISDMVYENDFSNIKSFTLQEIGEVVVESKSLKFVPLVGFVFSLKSINDNRNNAKELRPVYLPIPEISAP